MIPFRILTFSKKQVSPTYYAHVLCSHFAAIHPFVFILGALNAPRPPLSNAPTIFEKRQYVEKLQPKT